MVGVVELFRTSFARQDSRKVEPLSTSATARNGRSGEKKQEFHRVTPLRKIGLVRSCHATLRKPIRNRALTTKRMELVSTYFAGIWKQHFETSFNVPEQVSAFYVTRCNAC